MDGQEVNKDTHMDTLDAARERLRAQGITDPAQQDEWFRRSGDLLAEALEIDDRLRAEEELALNGARAAAASKHRG